jgi:glycerophosphoryl diester phosphodiesterase
MFMIQRIGHRGAAGYITENTIPSFEKALEMNVNAIELDVHICASGELVVFHDFTLDRLTNGTGVS